MSTIILANKTTAMVKPRLPFVTHKLLDEVLRAAAESGSNIESLMALSAIVAALVPTAAGSMPTSVERLREWSAVAYDVLRSTGATDAEIGDAGLTGINWLVDQMPRPAVIEEAAGNSSAQTEVPTAT